MDSTTEEKIMAEPEVPQKAPYIMTLDAGTYFWCACGRSKNQPFCDGSHKGTEFSPVEFTLEQPQLVMLCGCKHTKEPPFCDSSHSRI